MGTHPSVPAHPSDPALPPAHLWAGECPLTPAAARPGDLPGFVGALVNWGAEHSNLHTNQAILCWQEAERVSLERIRSKKRIDKETLEMLKEYREIAVENMGVVQGKKMFPYSGGADRVRALLVRDQRLPRGLTVEDGEMGDDDDAEEEEWEGVGKREKERANERAKGGRSRRGRGMSGDGEEDEEEEDATSGEGGGGRMGRRGRRHRRA